MSRLPGSKQGKGDRPRGGGARPSGGGWRSAPRREETKRGGGPEPRWVYGRHVVEEILESGKTKVLSLWILDGDREKAAQLAARAGKCGAKCSFVPKKELDRITNHGAHQGLAAKIVEKPGATLKDYVLSLGTEAKKDCVLVVLDQIQDPHNFGAIARSAACLGAKGVVFPERRSAPITQAVLSASAGAVTRIGTFAVGNLAETLKYLKEQGFWIYGADGGGRPVSQFAFNRPLALVIGSEGKGMRRLVREHCDELVAIPMSADGVESLNASCAASVLLYEAARQAASSGG